MDPKGFRDSKVGKVIRLLFPLNFPLIQELYFVKSPPFWSTLSRDFSPIVWSARIWGVPWKLAQMALPVPVTARASTRTGT